MKNCMELRFRKAMGGEESDDDKPIVTVKNVKKKRYITPLPRALSLSPHRPFTLDSYPSV